MLRRYRATQEARLQDGSEGFTLIELLIVIVVLGILAAVVVFALGSVTGNAKSSACQADAKQVLTAVQTYNAQNAPNVITAETSSPTMYSVTMDFVSFWGIGASVKDTLTNGTVVNTVVNGNGGVSSNHFETLNATGIVPGIGLTISFGSGSGHVLSVTTIPGSGITVGNPSTYGAAGTQAALLTAGNYVNAWPSTNSGYAISLSTSVAGHVVVYVPANASSGVDYANEVPSSGTTPGTGCFAL